MAVDAVAKLAELAVEAATTKRQLLLLMSL
jgi:hypothetical protein